MRLSHPWSVGAALALADPWTVTAGWLGLGLFLGLIGWLVYRSLKRSDDPARMAAKWIVSVGIVLGGLAFLVKAGGLGGRGGLVADFGVAVLIAGTSAACGILLGLIWAPHLGAWIARPLTSLYDGGDQAAAPEPLYSVAEARRKQGRYQEAMTEVRQQLSRFPGDLRGVLLLAGIQAEDLHDLTGAQSTIEQWLAQAGQAAGDISLALTQLADWQLRCARDATVARATLERIRQMFPGTEQAHFASQRIAHLSPQAMLEEKAHPHAVPLGQYADNVGLRTEPSPVRAEEDPAAMAVSLVAHLQQNPQDNEARERLACLYAKHYGRLDLATEQLEQLIAQPHVPARWVARWLNLLADLQIAHTQDIAAARHTLERVLERFPRSAAAETARVRIAHLARELHGQQKSQVVRLGSSPTPTRTPAPE